MYTMIRDMVAPYSFPVAFDFPVGHTGRNVPIPEGVMASLTVTQDEIFLDFLDFLVFFGSILLCSWFKG